MTKVREVSLLKVLLVIAIAGSSLGAQGRGGAPQPPPTAKAAAPVDLAESLSLSLGTAIGHSWTLLTNDTFLHRMVARERAAQGA